MIRIFKHIKLAFICLFVSTKLIGQEIDTNFVFNLEINPSFEPNQKYSMIYTNDRCIVNDIDYKLKSSDSIIISYLNNLDLIFKKYKFHKLGSYAYNRSGERTGMWTDGTSIRGIVQMDSLEKSFNFHSGNSDFDILQTEMMNTFFNIMFILGDNEKFLKKFTLENRYYLERMETRCTRNAMRKVLDKPLTYKLFERVYTFNYKEVKAMFDSFPTDQTTMVEIGRFFNLNIHDEFYDIFLVDISKRANVNWIVYQNNKDYLLSIGLKEENIIEVKEHLERPK